MNDLLQDLRFAARGLRKNPGFSLVAVLTLALGIGANSAMFSIANSFVWQPLAVEHPAGLVNVFRYNPNGGSYGDVSFADYQDLRALHDVFADVAAYYPYPFGLSEGGRSERTWGEIVSGNYFTMFGVRPARGRAFDEAETAGGAAAVTVISDGLWRRRFHADPGVLGRGVRVNGRDFAIIGVAPPTFHGVYYVGFEPDLWIPAGQFDAVVAGPPGQLAGRNGPQFRLMARLAPGVGVVRAQAAAQTVMARLAAEDPGHRGLEARVMSELDARPEPGIATGFALAARLFLAAVALVLLIACANVANLLLTRATGRRKEIAIRLAMGASRARLVRQLLAESLLLAGLGAVAGVALASWCTAGVEAMLKLPTDLPFNFVFAINQRVVAYTAVLALLAGVVFGLAPALQTVRPELVGALKNDAVSARGLHRSRLRGALVVAQIAVSCVLLITAGLALRTLAKLRDVNPGFDTAHGLLMTVAPDLQRYERPRGEAFYRALLARTAALPGVRAASLAQFVPLDFSNNGGRIFVPGHEAGSDSTGAEMAGWAEVMPGFFDALGVRLAEGRDFTVRDDSAAPGVVIVNQTFARRYWPGVSAVGRQFRLRAPDSALVTVVAVAPDMKYNALSEQPTPFVYEPLTQNYQGYATLVVRTAADPRSLAPATQGVIASLDPDMPSDVRTFADLMSGRALILPRFAATLAAGFAVLALALAVIGLYGVVSYAVSQRVREIGIRVALGARRGTVVGMVLRAGMGQAALGVGIGIVLALGATRALRSLLFGIGAADPLTFGVVALVLAAVAALASWIPARRAASVDPMVALRSE